MKLYRIFIIMICITSLGVTSCSKKDFEDSYTDPAKIANSTVAKQFTGFIYANKDYTLARYWNYFVVLRITLNRYNQTTGWVNETNQYIPGSAAVGARWATYYDVLAQYRDLQKIYNTLGTVEKANQRIYMIAAATYLYDFTQKVVDLHGDIPFSKAGMLSTNGGDYLNSYASYDTAESIYTTMLDDLKGFSTELKTVAVPADFSTQDIINGGSKDKWTRYVNSLRLRMLTRVSASANLGARAKTEIAEIFGNSATYPIVTDNSQNIKLDVKDLSNDLNSKEFQSGLEDWNGNIAGKAIIDHMNTNKDPRIRYIFEPGEKASGVYKGLDAMALANDQTKLIADGTIAIYNRSTLSRNQYFPGVLITASEVALLKAEYLLGKGDDAGAKTAYESAITMSGDFYVYLRSLSKNNTAGDVAAYTAAEWTDYLASSGVSWSKATTTSDKIGLIATQKWLHFNVVQAYDNWAEMRRLDAVSLKFWTDNGSKQQQPPVRWYYPGNEQTYNPTNYAKVAANDLLTTKLFWDIK